MSSRLKLPSLLKRGILNVLLLSPVSIVNLSFPSVFLNEINLLKEELSKFDFITILSSPLELFSNKTPFLLLGNKQ